MLNDVLLEIERRYKKVCSASATSTRVTHGKVIIALLKEHPEAQQYWEYLPNEFFWENRFKRVADTIVKIVPTFYDVSTDLSGAPDACGLYFFGNTAYNPATHEIYYWVKIGLSNNLQNRVKSYRTSNPSTFVIGYKETSDYVYEEHQYHKLLEKVALYRNQNSTEWWMVDRSTYLEMCEKSFDFFK